MKSNYIIALLSILFLNQVFALKEGDKVDVLTTKSGVSYRGVMISKITDKEIKIIHESGIAKIATVDLTPEMIKELGIVDKVESVPNNNNQNAENQENIEDLLKLWASQGKAFPEGKYPKGKIPVGNYLFLGRKRGYAYFTEYGPADVQITETRMDTFGYVHVNGLGTVDIWGWLINHSVVAQSKYKNGVSLFRAFREMKDIYNFSGMYHVGTDIAPGNRQFKAIGGKDGLMRIYDGYPGNSESNSEYIKGTQEVLLSKGQCVNISDLFIVK